MQAGTICARCRSRVIIVTRKICRNVFGTFLHSLFVSSLLAGCGRTDSSNAVAVLPSVCEEAGVICTVAGTGLRQFDGDGRLAVEASQRAIYTRPFIRYEL